MTLTKKEIFLLAKDKTRIAVDFYSGVNPKRVVIIAPGWCMTKNSKSFTAIAQSFTPNFDVLSMDFRGHGRSKGFYTFGANEIQDLTTVVNFAKEKGYEEINLAGFSLGAFVSLIYASTDKTIKHVIAVSAPSDFDKIEKQIWRKNAWFETFKKFELSRFCSLRMSCIPKEKIKPIDVVDKITSKTLFIAGEKDPTVFNWHTKALFEKATCEKQFKLYKNGIHAEDLFLHFKDDFVTRCNNWLNDKS